MPAQLAQTTELEVAMTQRVKQYHQRIQFRQTDDRGTRLLLLTWRQSMLRPVRLKLVEAIIDHAK